MLLLDDRRKRTVLLLAGLYSVILGLFLVLVQETGIHLPLIRIFSIICINLLVLAWCYFDSLERHRSLYPWLRTVIVIFGVFALFIYLFKSRGPKEGMVSSGLALLSLVGLVVVMLTSAIVSALVLSI
jgi:hypothetical protein